MFVSKVRMVGYICLSWFRIITVVWTAPDDVTFPPPVRSGGMGIFSGLQARRDIESFEPRLLHWEVLGNILWAACGLNRPDDATARTVPMLTLPFPVTIYLLAEDGVWQYDALGHRLTGVRNGDFRAFATASAGHDGSISAYVKVISDGTPEHTGAPVVLLLIADQRSSLGGDVIYQQTAQLDSRVKAALHAGHMAQNIQLAGSAEGIGVRAQYPPVSSEALIRALEMPSEADILLVLQLGYPAAR